MFSSFFRKIVIFSLISLFLLVIPSFSYERNFQKYPVIKIIKNVKKIVAISDIHGGLFQAINTLKEAGILKLKKGLYFKENEAYQILSPNDYNKFFIYCGDDAVIVSCGDMVSRGNWSREVIDLMLFLKKESTKHGGNLITLLGNHEVRILNGEMKKRALKFNKDYETVIQSFERAGTAEFKTYDDMITSNGKYGKWLRERPMAAIVDDIFFVHAGIKPTTTINKLSKKFIKAIIADDWNSKIFSGKKSPFWIKKIKNKEKIKNFWWKNEEDLTGILEDVNCNFMVVGHDPGAFEKKGKIGLKYNLLFNIDVGMTPSKGYSSGGGLIIKRNEKMTNFIAIESDKSGNFSKRTIYRK